MIQLKNLAHANELKNSIKRLVTDLHESSHHYKDRIAENDESVASYVARLNDEKLNRSFLDYCSAARNYTKHKR